MAKSKLKDTRFDLARNSIQTGYTQAFREIFDILPKSVLYQELGMNNTRFTKLMNHVEGFVLADLFAIANLIGISEAEILHLALVQYLDDKKVKGSSNKPNDGWRKRN